MSRYAIGLGSNLGDRLAAMRGAVGRLGELGTLTALSALYETAPVGGPEQGAYLNAVVVVEADEAPDAMLAALAGVESEFGRVRDERWGPRTLDLDIVAWDGPPVTGKALTIPHPRAAERRFVLEPLVEVWPDAVVGSGLSATAALGGVADQQVDWLAGSGWRAATDRGLGWVVSQFSLIALIGLALVVDGTLPDGLGTGLAVGAALVVAGVALSAAAAVALGPALTPLPEPSPGAPLVVRGPYRLVRHPIYGGVLAMALGAALALGSWVAALLGLCLGALFWLKSGHEERRLRMVHAGYRAYRLEVPKRFFPFLI